MVACVGFVLFLCAYITISGVYSVENCPNAKYTIEEPLNENAKFYCSGFSDDTCFLSVHSEEKTLDVLFFFTAPEDISDVYYNFSIVGNNTNAGSSGKAETEVMTPGSEEVKGLPKNSSACVDIDTKLEGNMPAGEEGVATVKLYFNEKMKGTPDICVTTNFRFFNLTHY